LILLNGASKDIKQNYQASLFGSITSISCWLGICRRQFKLQILL
jgi:hypothetical protein